MRRMLDELAAKAVGGEAEVDVAEWFQRVPQEVITFATFGRRNYEDGRVVFELQDELAGLAADAHSKVYIPGYRFLPLRRNLRVWHLVREIRKGLAAFIANLPKDGRDDEQRRDGGGGGMRDLMSFMTPAMTTEEIIEESKNFFFAGKETLVSLLTWATVALAMHPEWQDRARQEVLAVVGRDDLPTKDHLPKLKTVRTVLSVTRSHAREQLSCFQLINGDVLCMHAGGDDRERDAEAVPAGGGDDPDGEPGRGAGRVRGAGGHGAPHPDPGGAPRRGALGRRRGGVQPGALRRRPAAAAPDGVHAVRRRRAGVHRAEPGADRGQGGARRRAAAVRLPPVAGVRARAQGAHDTQPAVRRAGHLPAAVITPDQRRRPSIPNVDVSRIQLIPCCILPPSPLSSENV
uniref:Secologanin synthase n=1 Tax=Aegilops tauschii subsp. strangulata TaxID=200361 RepID=A0A453AWE1_AEGTS